MCFGAQLNSIAMKSNNFWEKNRILFRSFGCFFEMLFKMCFLSSIKMNLIYHTFHAVIESRDNEHTITVYFMSNKFENKSNKNKNCIQIKN